MLRVLDAALEHRDSSVRLQAAEYLGRGWADADAADGAAHAAVVERLLRIGDEAVLNKFIHHHQHRPAIWTMLADLLTRQLAADDPVTRQRALRAVRTALVTKDVHLPEACLAAATTAAGRVLASDAPVGSWTVAMSVLRLATRFGPLGSEATSLVHEAVSQALTRPECFSSYC